MKSDKIKTNIIMKRAMFAGIIGVLLSFGCPYVTALAEHYDTIDSYLEGHMKQAAIPNLSLGIIKDGKIVYLQSYGKGARGVSGAKNDLYAIGSVSKTFTALAARQLMASGSIDENASVSNYIPEFQSEYMGKAETITVGQLLSHTSGISQSAGGAPYIYNAEYSLEDVVGKSLHITLAHRPGALYEYSNLNYLILGRLVEIASGQTYIEYVKERILAPLGMTNTFPSISELQGKTYMQSYLPFYGGSLPVSYSFPEGISPAGGFFSTAEDLCRWMILYQQGGYINGHSLISNNAVSSKELADNDWCYNIFWTAVKKADTQTVLHNGSLPGYSSSVLMDPASGYGVVVLVNTFDQAGVFSSAPTPWILTEGIVAFLKTGDFPEQHAAGWNYTLLLWFAVLILGMAAFAVFVVQREVRSAGRRKGIPRIIAWAAVYFAAPALWLILVPLVNDCSWEWLLVSNPNVNLSILFIMAVLILTGIGKGIVMLIKFLSPPVKSVPE
ncbi:MAG: beta-lactamase [Paenibacillaceae bacterium]|nr:beta-lactamase [Paenibacillaceae bacterium]